MSYDHKEFVQRDTREMLSRHFDMSPCGRYGVRREDKPEPVREMKPKLTFMQKIMAKFSKRKR